MNGAPAAFRSCEVSRRIEHTDEEGAFVTRGATGRIRVAYFVPPSRHFAGIERVVHELATGLMDDYDDVLDVHVVFASPYDEDVLKQTNYTMHVLNVDRLRRLASALRSCVRSHRFDVLICPQVEASVVGWLATRGLSLPIFVSHLHGNPRIEESEGTRRTQAAFAIYRHIVSRRVAGVLAVSPSLRDYAAEFVAPRAEVYFVKNPVREIQTTRRIEGTGPFRFVNVARLSRQKGQDILLRALARARPELPPVSLTLVGAGPDEADLKRLSSDLGLDDIVVFTGYTSNPGSYFAAADCFVLPSRWEGFGMVLLEALQFGLPLLAADCDFGPADVITDPRIGDLVVADDAVAMAEGLIRAVSTYASVVGDDVTFRRSFSSAFSRKEAATAHYEVLKKFASTNPVTRAKLPSLGST